MDAAIAAAAAAQAAPSGDAAEASASGAAAERAAPATSPPAAASAPAASAQPAKPAGPACPSAAAEAEAEAAAATQPDTAPALRLVGDQIMPCMAVQRVDFAAGALHVLLASDGAHLLLSYLSSALAAAGKRTAGVPASVSERAAMVTQQEANTWYVKLKAAAASSDGCGLRMTEQPERIALSDAGIMRGAHATLLVKQSVVVDMLNGGTHGDCQLAACISSARYASFAALQGDITTYLPLIQAYFMSLLSQQVQPEVDHRSKIGTGRPNNSKRKANDDGGGGGSRQRQRHSIGQPVARRQNAFNHFDSGHKAPLPPLESGVVAAGYIAVMSALRNNRATASFSHSIRALVAVVRVPLGSCNA